MHRYGTLFAALFGVLLYVSNVSASAHIVPGSCTAGDTSSCTPPNSNGVVSCFDKKCYFTCAGGFQTCGTGPSDVCATNINTDDHHCGRCNLDCMTTTKAQWPGVNAVTCNTGKCLITSCKATQTSCGGDGSTYFTSCPSLSTDPRHCGSCSNACPSANNAMPACTGSVCSFTCNADYDDCDADPTNACETNLQTDVNNCGTCGTQCSFANAAATCSSGSCTMGACNTGYFDCDSDPSNGCEIQISSDTANCGSCNHACAYTNAAAVCSSSTCSMGTCDLGYTDCDQDGQSCETSTYTDTNNCGSCNNVCSAAHTSTYTCTTGSCGIGSCDGVYLDCQNGYSDGCETDSSNDVANCGACNNACPSNNAAPTCTGSVCSFTCNSNYDNCDADASNACETNLQTDVNNCGTCGTQCSFANAAATCSSGSCTMGACNTGYSDCDNNPSNGCETHTTSDNGNCGSCNHACTYTNAAGVCSSSTCSMGTCDLGYTDCDQDGQSCETSTYSDPTNCGSCNHACSAAQTSTYTCTAGSCGIDTCSGMYLDCQNGYSDGCETDGSSDFNNCGACGNDCNAPNTLSTQCTSGVCTIITCATNWVDCDGDFANGCEVDITSDGYNCGACSAVCNLPGVQPQCTNSHCVFDDCAVGWGNCNHLRSDGCEVDLSTVSNCRRCGHVCTVPHNALTAACSITDGCAVGSCQMNYLDCDGKASNGCEVLYSPKLRDASTSIYISGALQSSFIDTSTATHNLASSIKKGGLNTLSWNPSSGSTSYLSFTCATAGCIDTSATSFIGFYINGRYGHSQAVTLELVTGSTVGFSYDIPTANLIGNTWTFTMVPLVTSSVGAAVYDEIRFVSTSGAAQSPVNFAQIILYLAPHC